MQTSSENYYKVLQVDPSAEPEVITAAYHRLARKYHPDTNTSPDAKLKMQAINESYETLSNPAKRAEYDRNQRAAEMSGGAQANPANGSYALNARYRYEYYLKIREREEMARQQQYGRDSRVRSGQGGPGYNPYSQTSQSSQSASYSGAQHTAQGQSSGQQRGWNNSGAGTSTQTQSASSQAQGSSTWRRPPDVDASMRRWEEALDRQRKVQEQQRLAEAEARAKRRSAYAAVAIFVLMSGVVIGLVLAMGGSVSPLTVLIAVGISVGITVPTTFLLNNALSKK